MFHKHVERAMTVNGRELAAGKFHETDQNEQYCKQSKERSSSQTKGLEAFCPLRDASAWRWYRLGVNVLY